MSPIIDFSVHADVGVVSFDGDKRAVQRRVLRHVHLILGRIKQRTEVIGVEHVDPHRCLRVQILIGGAVDAADAGADLQLMKFGAFAVQHVHLTRPSADEQEAEIAHLTRFRFEEAALIAAGYAEADVQSLAASTRYDPHSINHYQLILINTNQYQSISININQYQSINYQL